MLDEGEDVGQDLAGVEFVGEAVDHRHAGVFGEALDDRLLEGADHHDVAHPRDHLGGVFDGLAAAELGITRVEVDGRAAELLHPRLEGQPRARAGLLEDHHQRPVEQRVVGFVALELLLDPAGAGKEIVVLGASEIFEL